MEGEQPLHWPPVPFTTPDCYITEGSSPPPTPGLGGQGRTGFWSWPMTETRGLRMDKRMDLLLINALLLGLSTLFCQAFATSMVRAIFLPMKCGEEPTSGSCVDGRETVEESKCLSSGCCYRNTTCYRKVSDSKKLVRGKRLRKKQQQREKWIKYINDNFTSTTKEEGDENEGTSRERRCGSLSHSHRHKLSLKLHLTLFLK
ncbi:uncharacterized protein [Narcine bancroftii]|uniref:uncharacterized protein isoform X1 n=1 Tax=Narcine bancroftii TaxID=1343680 RepID=UPI003831EDFC